MDTSRICSGSSASRTSICSSTTPSLPYGRAAAAEHLDMILIVHEGNPSLPEDVAAARERIHPKTMAAEGPLHELGAISIVNSDSQGMGRIGETVRRTWQLAHAMKAWRASAAGEGWPDALPIEDDDDRRVLRYLAKHTVEPARTHGVHGRGRDRSPRPPGRPGAVGAGVLRREARRGHEGRSHRLGPDRRGQRIGARGGADQVGPDWGGTGDAPRASRPPSSRRPRSRQASNERSGPAGGWSRSEGREGSGGTV